MRSRWPGFFGLSLLLVLGLSLAGCGGNSGGSSSGGSNSGIELKLAPVSALPDFVKKAPPQVQEAYRFAIANQAALKLYPCYCGCGKAGHKNNLECYIQGTQPDGSLAFDDHAYG
ncbi:MAG: hypothetical protein A2Z04_08145 [Chloroflexi bacterium RBG_16_57_9]|nr:MAG: hypothetical protein A2Z04_08145 [Chloroflexi bacterium RBG_16_57_9]